MSQPVSLSSDTQISRSSQADDSGAIRALVVGILAVLLISSLSINMLLYRQHKEVGDALKLKQTRLQQMETLFNQREKPVIDSLVGALTVFAKTSPDFAPALQKYRAAPTNAAATNSDSKN